VVVADKTQLLDKMADLVAAVVKWVYISRPDLERLDKDMLAATEMLLEITVVEVAEARVVSVESAIQKLQVMVALEHLTLYQDHYNITAAVAAQV
jgi:hypothetical protein